MWGFQQVIYLIHWDDVLRCLGVMGGGEMVRMWQGIPGGGPSYLDFAVLGCGNINGLWGIECQRR